MLSGAFAEQLALKGPSPEVKVVDTWNNISRTINLTLYHEYPNSLTAWRMARDQGQAIVRLNASGRGPCPLLAMAQLTLDESMVKLC